MRKIILLLGIALLGLTGLAGGTFLTVQAFSYETADGAKYNYFSNPKLLTVQNNFIYLIDGERGYESLLKINVESGQTATQKTLTESEEPKHIAVANNLLFVFYPTKFYTYSTTDLSLGGYYLYSDAGVQQTAFHVSYASGTYYIYHGKGASAARKSFNTSLQSGNSLTSGITYNLYSQAINGISTNSANNTVYFLATDPYVSSQFRIYSVSSSGGTPQYIDSTDQNFFNAKQFNFYNGVHYFLSHDGSLPKLTAYHNDMPSYLENDFAYQNFITMKKSIRPIALHVVDASKIFVIDEEKQSIDMYSYDVATRTFTHERIIAGHKGDDSGYYYEPLSVCVIDENRYVVADRTGVKLIKNGVTIQPQFIERGDGAKQVAQVRQIAFDMWENLYIYDSKKRIQIYRLVANDKAEYVKTLTNGGNFDQIVQLAAGTDQTVWALDSSANCVWQIKPDHTIIRKNFQVGVTINTNSRGMIKDGGFTLLQEMSNVGTTKIDVVIDALEKPVYLTKDNSDKYFVESENLDQPKIEIIGASPVSPFSLSLDRLNGKLFWIGSNYSIQSFDLSNYGYWSPKGYPSYEWNNTNNKMEYETHAKDYLYMKVKASAVLYKLPGAIKPKNRILIDSNAVKYVQVLQYSTVMGVKDLNWAYVLYHPIGTQNLEPLYISHDSIETSNDFAIKDCRQFTNKFSNSNTINSGRVILRNTLIYLYPSSASPTISTIHKNHGFNLDKNGPGLIINREIKVPDYDGVIFYEILVDVTGQPPNNAVGGIVPIEYCLVGYVNTTNVVDTYAAPSDVSGFATNGKIKISREHNDGKGAQVYKLEAPHEPHEGEFLVNGTRIRIIGKYGDGFTHIAYTSAWATEDGVVGEDLVFYGLVRTDEIDPDGVTWWQISAIIALIISIGVALFIGIRHWKSNK